MGFQSVANQPGTFYMLSRCVKVHPGQTKVRMEDVRAEKRQKCLSVGSSSPSRVYLLGLSTAALLPVSATHMHTPPLSPLWNKLNVMDQDKS